MPEHDNSQEMLPLVNEAGKIIGSATRGRCHSGEKLLHPVVHLHVFDRSGRLFLQKRPMWKDIQPGKWDTAVGGHIDCGEDVMTALHREAREELGLTDFIPEFLTRYIFESARERELVNVFRTTVDTVPVPSDELDGGAFWSASDIAEALGEGILTPNFESEYQKVFLNGDI